MACVRYPRPEPYVHDTVEIDTRHNPFADLLEINWTGPLGDGNLVLDREVDRLAAALNEHRQHRDRGELLP